MWNFLNVTLLAPRILKCPTNLFEKFVRRCNTLLGTLATNASRTSHFGGVMNLVYSLFGMTPWMGFPLYNVSATYNRTKKRRQTCCDTFMSDWLVSNTLS